MLSTMLPPNLKLTLGPMLNPMLANMTGEQLAGIADHVREIGGKFTAIDQEFAE